MKVAAITGPQQCEFIDKPDLQATDEFLLVKVRICPMCTEYKLYRAGQKLTCLGHEAAGEVVDAGRSARFKAGDRVVVMPLYACGRCELCASGDYIHCERGGNPPGGRGTATYAEYLLKQDWQLLAVPDDMSLEHASMACCGLGPTFGAMQRMAVDAFDTVLIAGMGPVGLGGVINGTYRGARVFAVESHPYRKELASRLGAAAVIDPTDSDALAMIRDLTRGRGVDKAIDCSGAPAAQRLLIDAARRKGHVSFVGEAGPLEIRISDDMLRKGLTLHGCWHWNLLDTRRMMQLLRASAAKLDLLITHRFPMTRVKQAWELQLTGNCGKVLLDPWGE